MEPARTYAAGRPAEAPLEAPTAPAKYSLRPAADLGRGSFSAAPSPDSARDYRPLLLRIAALLALIFLVFATPLRRLFGFGHKPGNPSSEAPR